jgi:hypothetical protein
MDLKLVGKGVEWIEMVHYRDKWVEALVSAVMNRRVP